VGCFAATIVSGPTRDALRVAPGPVDAAGTVDAQTAPTAPWKTLRGFHELPQGILSTKSSTDRLNHPQILLRNLFSL